MDINVVRTGIGARSLIEFLYGKAAGNGLGIKLVNGLAVHQFCIIFAGSCYRADFYTITTCSTFIRINIAGDFVKGHLKISILSVNLFDI
jgi:hypothetical protein